MDEHQRQSANNRRAFDYGSSLNPLHSTASPDTYGPDTRQQLHLAQQRQRILGQFPARGSMVQPQPLSAQALARLQLSLQQEQATLRSDPNNLASQLLPIDRNVPPPPPPPVAPPMAAERAPRPRTTAMPLARDRSNREVSDRGILSSSPQQYSGGFPSSLSSNRRSSMSLEANLEREARGSVRESISASGSGARPERRTSSQGQSRQDTLMMDSSTSRRGGLSRSLTIPERAMSESLPDTANAFSTSLPIRATSDLPANYQRPGPTRPSNNASISSDTSMAQPLFGSHPSGDPAYWIAKARPPNWVPPRRTSEPSVRTSAPPACPALSTSLLSRALKSKAAAPSGSLGNIREPSDSSVLSDSSSVSDVSASEPSSEAARKRSSKAKPSGKLGKSQDSTRPSGSQSTSQRERRGGSSGAPYISAAPAARARPTSKRRTSVAHPGITAYTILGVEEDTPQNKLRRVFRAMTDKLEAKLQNGGGPPELHVAVMEKIGEVKKAYAAIGTEKLRRKYDRYLDGSSPSSSSSEEGNNHRRRVTGQLNYYELLQVEKDATVEDIKRVAQDYIDFYADVKAQAMDEATFFQAKASEERIQRAYVTLANPVKRKAYDKRLRYGSDYESDTEAPAPPISGGNGNMPQTLSAPHEVPRVPIDSATDARDRKEKGREGPRRSDTASRRSGHERKSSKSKSSRSKRYTSASLTSEDDSSSDRKASRSHRERESKRDRDRANAKGKSREKDREAVRHHDRDRERRRRSSRQD